MSRWIRPKYNEQCKENANFTKKSVSIDSRRAAEGFWLKILTEKCPEGLGKTSENLKNNKDLEAKDFLDDEDAFLVKGATTVQYPECYEQNNSFARSPRRLSMVNEEVKQDAFPFTAGEQEDNIRSLGHEFKTPVLPKHNTSSSSITATPCLFSPELISQSTQDVTPKNHVLNTTPCRSETISRLLESQPSSSPAQSQFSCVHNSQENVYEKSPDILALMIADNRPRSSLALLSATSSDDEIDGWSDSMATPPVQWSPSQKVTKEEVGENKKSNDKHVARTLFEGNIQDISSEMSGFSVLESSNEQNDTLSKTLLNEDEETCTKPDDVVELGRIFHQETSLKDGSLLKMIGAIEDSSLHLSQMDDLASSDVLQTERIGFSRERENCACEEKKCTCLIDGNEMPVLEYKFEEDVECQSGNSQPFSSLLSPPTSSTMLPPPDNTTSPIPYSQEVQKFLDLVQSTPKIPGNMVERKMSKIRTEECYKNSSKNNIILGDTQTFSLSGTSDLLGNEVSRSSTCGNDSKATRSSFLLEHDSISCDVLNDITSAIDISSTSASSLPLREATALDVNSKPNCGGDPNDSMSFQVFKTPVLYVPSSAAESFPEENNAKDGVTESDGGCEDNSLMSFDIPSTPKLPSSSLPTEVDTSKPHRGDEAHDVSFGSISTSLEKAMVEETEKVLSKTTESALDKKTADGLSNIDEHSNATKLKTMNSGKRKQFNTETNKSERNEKSPHILLGVRRSSRIKRFSYPVSRKPLVSRNSMELKAKRCEVDATSCDLSKITLKKENLDVGEVKMEKMYEREKEIRNIEQVGKSRDSQKCGEETSHSNNLNVNQEDINQTDKGTERKGWLEKKNKAQKKVNLSIYGAGLDQTSCIRNKPTSNIKSRDIFNLKNTTPENQESNQKDISTRSEDYISEDMTDNTLISIQEDFETPQKATCTEVLYDMDALSQFPVELLSPTQLDPVPQTSFKDLGQIECNAKPSIMSVFKTAGGKDVTISEEAIKKAKTMFEMENREADGNSKSSMTGFKTAGGKDVCISEEAIKEAKAMFEIENRESDGNSKPSMTRFKTAGGKDVSISEEAIKQAKAMFEIENREADGNSKPSMTRFKTAGGKDVSISEEAIKQAKAMFEIENRESDGNSKPSMTRFKSAGGKDVSISEEAIQKAKAMFEIENREADGKTKSPMTGFKTAGGKDVSISEEAMKKAKAMFEMENREADGNAKPFRTGFKKAGGKGVNISEEAMKKAKAMFEIENREADGKTKSFMMTGFKTAGGKDVSISEKTIKKAKAMFEIENREADGNAKSSMTGFKTAGGNDVSISEEAMKKAKAMFEMENREADANAKSSMMTGYKTAGGKVVNITEEAIQKAKVMFEMENREVEANAKPSMTGFKTAGGKDVTISKEAIKKAKAMFEMENREAVGNTKPSMTGFKTAGGKDVSISEEAMKKAKAMFEIENREADANAKSFMMTGFKTAGGNDVSISEEAMKKAKAMFEIENREADGNAKSSMMTGYKTAGGKVVNISEEAIQKAKAMFEMENREVEANAKPSMTGFKTAGGKDVTISEEAIKKANAMFKMENREADGNSKPSMTGFKTAGGKDVSISEEAMKKAKAMFETENREADANAQSSMMTGFKTAGGKDVSISEDAIKKDKAMFEIENREADGKTKSSMTGFKTAGGKDVSISEEAMKKAKAMFEMENREAEANAKPSMTGFKTAGGKDVTISEEAIKKANAMFEMENREADGNTKPSMTGFKTAGGKDVSISEEAMKKAKAMFETENREADANAKSSMMTGFKTAGGKDVGISEEAMKKAKAMFEMENREAEANAKSSMMTGFKTAGGKDVNISEEAMKKAKAMFEMENREADGKTKSPMTGFKTAGGIVVSISEEAMKKAKAMFEMENREADGNAKPFRTGFKKAGGKGVNISEEAMKKAKAMFEIENREANANAESSMSGFKTAGGKDVNISEEAIKKAKAMFEIENRETEKNKNNSVKCELDFKARIVEINVPSCTRQEVILTGANGVSSKKTKEIQSDQEVPLFKVLTPSKSSTDSVTLFDKTCPSPISVHSTSIVHSTPIQDVDENLSREILESSAALIADESFTNFSECGGIQDERFLVPNGSTKNRKTGNPEMCQSEPRLSKREALLANARRRSAPFLSNGDRTNPSLQTRSNIMPMRSSPSAVLYDRRSKMFSPPLKSLIVSPNTSTPMYSFPPARKEAKRLFVKQGNSLNPSVTSPTQPSPLAAEGRPSVNQRTPTTAHTGIPKQQFTTPYRSTSPFSNPTPSTHKEEGNGSPERKRPRILGPGDNKRSAAKPENRGSESVKPKMGYLFKLRQNSTRINMKKYVDGALPRQYTEQELHDSYVMDDAKAVTSHNAESYRFVALRFFSNETCASNQGVRTEDGGLLFIGEDGRIGVEEIEKGLLTTPGVDVTLIPHGWIANHYRWIVWKLAAMETAFPRHFAGRCLNPDSVLCQLKYRYDREIDRSHRSALKKILERDDLSSRTIVLCVSSVTTTKRDTEDGNEEKTSRHSNGVGAHEASTVIELTDGWYSVNAVLDAPLTNLLSKGKIFEGLKLCINGAELIGSDQAVSPLEAPSSLMLRISANSTRRARWNTRLGFHSYSHPFPLPLRSLYPDGGVVGCVDVVVLRQYPVEYMEKLPNGTTVFRNTRAEEREAKRFGRDLDRAREDVFTKVQREFEEVVKKSDARSSKKARSFSPKDISKLRNSKELYDAYTSASDPSFFEECLDNNQKASLEDYRRTSLDSKRAELENMFQRAWDENDQNISKRTVVPLLKVRLINYSKCNEDKTEAILSIWRPNEDVVQLLAEGSRLRIYHLMASGSRYRQGLPSLQFSSTRSTRYKTMSIDHDITDDIYSERKTTSLDELQTNPPALYSEVDLVGVIVSVTSHNSSSLQTVYISDEDHYLVSIKFWGGLKTYALDDLVKPRNLVACSDLVVRSTERVSCPTLAFNELSTLTLKPRELYLRTALDHLNDNIQDMDVFMDIAQRSLDKIRRPDNTHMNCSRVSDRDSPLEDKTIKGSRTENENTSNFQGGRAQTLREKDLVPTPVSRPLSGQCKRKLLESMPEPPAAPSINVSVSESVRRDFKRPRRLTTGIPR